jgi:hypothetical protein
MFVLYPKSELTFHVLCPKPELTFHWMLLEPPPPKKKSAAALFVLISFCFVSSCWLCVSFTFHFPPLATHILCSLLLQCFFPRVCFYFPPHSIVWIPVCLSAPGGNALLIVRSSVLYKPSIYKGADETHSFGHVTLRAVFRLESRGSAVRIER